MVLKARTAFAIELLRVTRIGSGMLQKGAAIELKMNFLSPLGCAKGHAKAFQTPNVRSEIPRSSILPEIFIHKSRKQKLSRSSNKR